MPPASLRSCTLSPNTVLNTSIGQTTTSGMAFRAREFRVEVARVVMQRQRGEDRVVGFA